MHPGENPHSRKALGPSGNLGTISAAAMATLAILVASCPSHAYTMSSHIEVQSDGTVHGWGITDATPPPGFAMTHTAYIRTTLTSPNGRTDYSGTMTGANVVRADVWLRYVPGDVGTFTTDSYHGAWCPVWGRWVIPLWGPHTSVSASLRATQWAALRYDSTVDECGHKKRTQTYQGLDNLGWVPRTEYWKLNESFSFKDPSCGTIGIDGSENGVGFADDIWIGCYTPSTCVFETNQTISVRSFEGAPLTQVPGRNCVGMTDTQCLAQPAHSGWHVRATATAITVTDNP